MIIKILTEGASDVPVMHEILSRHFNLIEHIDFEIHPHRGRGNIPNDVLAQPDPKHRGLLDQLPAKLRGFAKYMDEDFLVVVLIDLDNDDEAQLLSELSAMLGQLPTRPPRILFGLAVEEVESWFLADKSAIISAFPTANLEVIKHIQADSIIGAWERLADCFGKKHADVTGHDKTYWAEKISPHLDFQSPNSPSLSKLIKNLTEQLA